MTEAPGHPDDEPWGIGFGALLASGANVDPTGGLDLLGGTPIQAGHAYQVVVHAKTTAAIALVAEWELEGAPAGVTVQNTATLTPDASNTGSALLPTLGHNLVSLTATGGDATTSFAVAGSGQRPLASAAGGTAAFAYLFRDTVLGDAQLTVNALGSRTTPFLHFHTTDLTVFGTSSGGPGTPTNASGDDTLNLLKQGYYLGITDARWTAANFTRYSRLSFVGSDVQPGFLYPGNMFNAADPFGVGATHPHTAIGGFVSTGTTASMQFIHLNNAGVNHTIEDSYMTVLYLPVSAADATVFG